MGIQDLFHFYLSIMRERVFLHKYSIMCATLNSTLLLVWGFSSHSRVFIYTHLEKPPLPVNCYKFGPILGTHGYWAVRVLYCATPVVTWANPLYIMDISEDPWHSIIVSVLFRFRPWRTAPASESTSYSSCCFWPSPYFSWTGTMANKWRSITEIDAIEGR